MSIAERKPATTPQPSGPEGSRTVYLNNAATSWPKAPGVSAAMAEFLDTCAGNPGRGAAEGAKRVTNRVRSGLAMLINAGDPDRVILTHGCTDALNLSVHGIVDRAARQAAALRVPHKPHVVISAIEHNSLIRPLERARRDGDIQLTVVPCDDRGFMSPGAIIDACTERTVLVCAHASNVVGTIQPIHEIGVALRATFPRAMFLVDAATTIGLVPVDVRDMHADLLAFGAHKVLRGPTGIGGLYIGPRAYEPGDPESPLRSMRLGGTGSSDATMDSPRELPKAFEAGTSNTVGCAGLAAAIDALDPNALRHERRLVEMLIRGLSAFQSVRIFGPLTTDLRTGTVSFTAEGWAPADLAAALESSFDIVVRAGLNCAPLVHQRLGTAEQGGVVRVSPGPDSTEQDIEQFLAAMRELLSG